MKSSSSCTGGPCFALSRCWQSSSLPRRRYSPYERGLRGALMGGEPSRLARVPPTSYNPALRAAASFPGDAVPETMLLRIGHSPDPDDAFMYYALAKRVE